MPGRAAFSDLRKLWLDRKLLFRTLAFLKPWLGWHGLGLLLTFLSAGLSLVQPWVSRLLIDKVLIQGDVSMLVKVCLAFFGAVVLGSLTGMAMSVLFSWVGQSAAIDLRMALYSSLNRLSMAYAGRKRLGDLMAGFTSDIPVMQGLYSSTLSTAVSEVVRFFVVLAVMITINPGLTLLAVPSIPLFAVLIALAGTMIKKASAHVQDRRAYFTATLQEQLAGLRTAAAFGLHRAESGRFRDSMTDLMRANIMLTVKGFVFNAGSLLASTTLILVIWLGGNQVIRGEMQVGVLIAFISYFGMLFGPVGSIAGIASQALKAMGAAERVFGVIDTEPAVKDLPGAVDLECPRGRIEFRDVCFGYDGGPPVLKDFSAVVEPGETVAVAGDSGAGKTTIVSLLLRFYDPDGGTILIDGTDIRTVTLESLRRNIGVVFQDPFMYHCSVADNIRIGMPGAGMDQVREAARAAHAHRFIQALPQGYETIVVERGSTLSGGQIQRIALARVFLRNPPIVILDEATSALDQTGEEKVQSAVKELLRNRTCIVIAHRRSSVDTADRILRIPLLEKS